jgi:hypothetical protein
MRSRLIGCRAGPDVRLRRAGGRRHRYLQEVHLTFAMVTPQDAAGFPR